ncbi:hypothetical protein NQ317_012330 [Molorchus minor]|uniref:Uncharacterized protein n=1 Tax=Molorchus minor TaxID=1323400 RepID=A0ABQ9IRH9_9CUCU|nr:hypothetical protein NQ317_012330 [Molorchus minor]
MHVIRSNENNPNNDLFWKKKVILIVLDNWKAILFPDEEDEVADAETSYDEEEGSYDGEESEYDEEDMDDSEEFKKRKNMRLTRVNSPSIKSIPTAACANTFFTIQA